MNARRGSKKGDPVNEARIDHKTPESIEARKE